MFGRKKGFTASQSKSMSRKMQSSYIGTHVARKPASKKRHMNAEDVGFASSRKKQRAARGMIDHVMPNASSGENAAAYSRRVSHREYARQIQRGARLRRIVVAVVAVVLVAAVGIGAGTAGYLASVGGKLALPGDGVSGALSAQEDGAPYYVLLSADLDASNGSNDDVDALLLARVNEQDKTATLVQIPVNLRARMSDGEYHQLSEARAQGGDAELVQAVASFAGVGISHYARTDAEGLSRLVDELGGIEVQLEEEVDDPSAGNVYIEAGERLLDGQSTLVALRAKNFTEGLETQARHQCAIAAALAEKLLALDAVPFVLKLDSLASDVQTDWSAKDVVSVAGALRGLSAASVLSSQVPGYETTSNGETYYAVSSSAWQSMMELVESGQDPAVITESGAPASVDPASFEITVRNGSGVTGGASQLADILAKAGYQVEEVGNADNQVYNETLVVYNDEAMKPAAEAVVETLGSGRAIPAQGFYVFDTDILVVLGKDWKPLN